MKRFDLSSVWNTIVVEGFFQIIFYIQKFFFSILHKSFGVYETTKKFTIIFFFCFTVDSVFLNFW